MSRRRGWAMKLVLGAVVGLGVGGCSSAPVPTPPSARIPASAPSAGPGPTTPSAPSASVDAAPSSSGPGPAAAPDASDLRVVRCEQAIAVREELLPGYVATLDGVALADARQLGSPREDGLRFAKAGLYVRPGANVDLVLPPDSPHRLAWGNGNEPRVRRLRFPGCRLSDIRRGRSDDEATPNTWLIFAGGYFVEAPTCLEIRVEHAGRSETRRIGVGAECPSR